MATTNFVDRVTPINASWLNDVDAFAYANVTKYGALGDGITSDSTAITQTNINETEVVFIKGNYLVSSSVTIDKPVIFLPGAYLTIASGQTVTINNIISSPRQHIFRGDGSVLLNNEDSHTVYPQWFGAFADESSSDAGPALQKLADSVVSGRECLIDFDAGTWYLSTAVNWSRACAIVGAGKRLTHFRCSASFSTGDVFTTAEQGVSFRDIQFSSATTPRTSGSYINMSYNYCVAKNIWFTDGFIGINVGANVCTVEDVTGFLWSSAAGSTVVNLVSGYNTAAVDNIKYIDTAGTSKPKFLINTNAHTKFQIGRIYARGVETAINVGASSGTGGFGHIDSIICESPSVNAMVFQTSGTGAVESVSVDSITADTLTGTGLAFVKDGSGVMKFISIGKINFKACDVGVNVTASTGRVDHWSIAGGFVRSCAGNGFNIEDAYYWSITDCQSISNVGTGTLIANTAANFVYSHNQNRFNGTDLTNNGTGTNYTTGNL